ncbi:uncharacterized protein [Chlorocebus sabaeus]|uniref:uncharacterized protein n=1 Tax=Chlorocebus sabaeus TaxID=60711 RepID=UPI003BF978AB
MYPEIHGVVENWISSSQEKWDPRDSVLLDQSTVLSPFLVSLVPQIPTPSSRACFDDPAGRDTWRPNRDLETRDSVRKRTPKDGRPLTKTKESELFRSPREPAASESKEMKPNMRFLWRIIALYNIVTVYAGFGDPRKARGLLRKQYGQPCDCRGGQISEPPSDRITQVTCSGKTADLMPDQSWKCKSTPRDTSPNGPLLECPCSSFQSSVHSSCYTSYQQCKSGNKTYYTATLLKTQTGSTNDVQVLGTTNKLVQSSCNGQKGKPVCWSTTAPIHISDGGGPLDIARIKTVQKKLEKIHKALYPELQYHPLALPEIRNNFRLDAQTFDILNATYNLLQMSNTSLAHDCWLCLKMGPPIPLAIPNFLLSYVNYSNESLVNNSCPIISPLLVQPMTFSNSFCLFSPSYNSTKEIDLGYVVFDNCTSIIHATDPLCAVNGSVFVCGNNMAYTYLPTNWTGLCVLATLLPDIDIIPGDEPIPIPAIEHFIYRPKRAIQFIPLLAGLGITTAFTTGATGLGKEKEREDSSIKTVSPLLVTASENHLKKSKPKDSEKTESDKSQVYTA